MVRVADAAKCPAASYDRVLLLSMCVCVCMSSLLAQKKNTNLQINYLYFFSLSPTITNTRITTRAGLDARRGQSAMLGHTGPE